MQYSKERKGAALKKMMPPHNRSVVALAGEEGISEATLYIWRLPSSPSVRSALFRDRF